MILYCSVRSGGATSDGGCDGEEKYAMKWRFRFNSKKSKTMMVGGKGSGGECNEKRMENVEVFKYLGVWFDRGKRGNVHLEKMRGKPEKWGGGGKNWLYEQSKWR